MTKVLIVDDNEQNLYMLQVLLTGHGYEVESATHGAEALEAAGHNPPDLIVTDILMPVMDGFALCREWQKDEQLKQIPFIFYTATYTDPKDREFALSLGAARFILKPTEPDVFIEILREVLENRQAGRLVAPSGPMEEDEVYFKEYNEALIRKLEDKMMQLEETNRALEHDIAERKRIKRALQEGEKRYRAVIENAPIVAWVTGRDGRTVFISSNVEEVYGYSSDEILEGEERLWFGRIHPEDKERVKRAFELLFSRQREFDIEYRIQRKDGQWIWLHDRANIVEEKEGHSFAYGVFSDITERKQAEDELATTQALLMAAIGQTPAGVIVADVPDVNIRIANSAAREIRGETLKPLTDIPLPLHPSHWQIFQPDGTLYAPEDLPLSRAILCGETSRDVEVIIRRETGEERWVSANAAPIRDADGEIVAGIVIFPDITERKHLEEQFRQVQKMEALGRLAGGVAHDFNNLLTVIRMSTEMLKWQLRPEDPLWESVREIEKAGERATALTRQLLSFSRQEVVRPQRLDLSRIVGNLSRMLRRIIGEDIELVTVLADDLWSVSMDPTQVDQVIMNVAVNARDAMLQGGVLTIETANVVLDEGYAAHHVDAQPGEHVMLAITDTGVGMDDEVKAHLFEPFFTTKERGKGTGLGLSTVYGIVKQSGGHIWVYSEVGYGTAFKIYLPRVKEVEAEVVKDERRPVVTSSPRGTETILLVEDDADVRNLAVNVLKAHGYQVLTARGGAEAIQLSTEHDGPVHLLVSDVVMPGMSGRELAEQLQQRRAEMRVLYMSGYSDAVVARHGMLREGLAFLPKPFTVASLLQKIEAVLG